MKQKSSPGYTEDLRPEFHSFTTDYRGVLENVNYNIVTRDHVSDYDTEHDVRLVDMIDFRRTPKAKKSPESLATSDDGAR